MKFSSITVDELIEALQIFQKHQPILRPDSGNVSYADDGYLCIEGYEKSDFTKHELKSLKSFGFTWDPDDKCFCGSEYNPKTDKETKKVLELYLALAKNSE